MVPLMFFKI